MEKLLIRNFQSPGDLITLTAAIRDLHIAHPSKYLTNVQTSCPAIFENNPYLADLGNDYRVINLEYPLVHKSNVAPYHFIHGFAQSLADQLKIPHYDITNFRGQIFISNEERSWMSQIEEMGIKDKFWLIHSGGKTDFTCKEWGHDNYQKVVDHFKGKITFVQCGEIGPNHTHKPLNNVINLLGKTDLRQFIRLIYHSIGALCGVTFLMHACPAIESKHGLASRPCVVLAGARESMQWEAYNGHRYLCTNGTLNCSGCWKSRIVKLGDGDPKDNDLCLYPINIGNNTFVPKCMNLIRVQDVIRSIEMYYEGGVLQYN